MRIRLKIRGADVALAPGQSVNREFESNLLNREAEVTDFSYPCKVQLTDDTIRAMGYVHVLEISDLSTSYAGQLIIDEVMVRDVTVYLLTVDDEAMMAEVSIVGDYGSYRNIVGSKKLSDLSLGGVRTIGTPDASSFTQAIPDGIASREIAYHSCNSHIYMDQLANGSVVDDFVFPMCVDLGNPGVTNLWGRSIFNAYWADGVPSNEHWYADPIATQLNMQFMVKLLIPETGTEDRYFWVPMFRLAFVLRKCFEEFGFTILPGSVLDDLSFKTIILYNTYAINRVSVQEEILGGTTYVATIFHNATTVNPKNHMPDMEITEFIVEEGKKHNLQFDIDFTLRTVAVKRLDNIEFEATKVDLTNTTSKYSLINFTQNDAKWRNGYTFYHELDPGDNFLTDTEAMDSMWGTNITHVFNSKFAMDAYGPTMNGAHAYVYSENAIYKFSTESNKFHFKCHYLGKLGTSASNDRQDIRTKVCPMPMYMHTDKIYLYRRNDASYNTFNPDFFKENILLPTSSYGVCGEDLFVMDDWLSVQDAINTGGEPWESNLGTIASMTIPKVSVMPRIMNWVGRAAVVKGISTDLYPSAWVGTKDVNGDAVGVNGLIGYNLMWQLPGTPYGTYAQWWQRWCNLLLNGVPVDIEMVIEDVVLYEQLKWNRIIFARKGLRYILMKSYESMPFPSTAKLEAFLLK